jgi:hypothetical protein
MIGIFSLLSKYYLQVGETIQKEIAGVGEKSQEAVGKSGQFSDLPGITDEKQTVVDEDQVNEAFEPANDAFSGLRDAGDWIIQTISDLFNQIFGSLM